MSYLITKLDFPEFVPLSVNVADALVNPYIRDAYEFDIEKLLTAAEWTQLKIALAESTLPDSLQLVWKAVRALWVLHAFRLFLRWHGTHLTANGVESFTDGTNQPVTPARRAELIADINGRVNLYRGKLEAALRTYRTPSSTTTCTPTRRRPSRGGAKSYAV